MTERSPTPRDFFSDAPPPRMMGTETEHGAPHIVDSSTSLARRLYDSGMIPNRPNNHGSNLAVWLINGAKLYFDCKLVEYASAEAQGPFAATATDHAGIKVMELVHTATPSSSLDTTRWPSRRSGTYSVSDKMTRTQGTHENFIMPYERNTEKKYFELVAQLVATYAITRPIWYGAGFVVGNDYHLSQKALGVGTSAEVFEKHNATSETNKPLVRILDSSYRKKAPPQWAVGEIRHADSHMIPYATFMGLGTASLVLRLVEQGYVNHTNIDDLTLRDPQRGIYMSSKLDKNLLHNRFEMKSGAYKTALSIQRELSDMAADLNLNSKITLPMDEQIVADEWVHLCDLLGNIDVTSGDFTPLLGRVEWATKYHILQRRMGGKAAKSMIKNVAFDYQWTQLGPMSLGKKVAAKLGMWNDWFTDEIDYRVSHPPVSRAMARASLIANGYTVDQWSNSVVSKDHSATIVASDPYASQPIYVPIKVST